MIQLNEILEEFDPILLGEMDEVKFLNRMDTKFVFSRRRLPDLLKEIKQNYRSLQVNGTRVCRYETLYFDTPGHNLYLMHHNGKLNRYKVRFRKYIDSNSQYFEIKFKNNKGRTIKKRHLNLSGKELITGDLKTMIEKFTPLLPDQLTPILWVNFSRMTLINKNMLERMTIDVNLRFKNEKDESILPGIVIAEVKQERSGKSVFSSLMHRNHISDMSVSKYCLGTVCLDPDIKHNNFKPKLLTIKKICHDLC